MSSSTQFPRRPYTGSCHCGQFKYIVYLPLPTFPYPKATQAEFRESSGLRMYRCNCTFCHKAGLLHVRPSDPHNDFFVISPKNPMQEGSGFKSYVPKGASRSWYFCEHCGTRPFAMHGPGYNDEVDLPTALLQRVNSRALDGTPGEITAKDGETTRVMVYRPSKEWRVGTDEEDDDADGLTINGMTLDAHNENFDLRQLHEKGYLGYMQTLQWIGYDYVDTPFFGGAY